MRAAAEPPDHQAEADDQDRAHEADEEVRQHGVVAERVHRLHHSERVMNVPKIVRKNVTMTRDDVPDAEHAAPLLHHHRMEERGGGEPGQQRGVLDRIPAQ